MKRFSFLFIVIAGACWGTSGIFLKYLEPYGFGTLSVTSIRGVSAALFMGIFLILYNRSLFKTKLSHLVMYAFSGLAVLGTAAFYFLAIQATTISTAVVLMYTAPVFVMAFSVSFLKEKLTVKKLVAVFAVLCGCVLISGILADAKFSLYGLAMGLMAGVSYSSYNVITRIEMLKGCNSLTATFYSFCFMAIFSLFLAPPAETISVFMYAPAQAYLLSLGIGFINCVLPYAFYTFALKHIPAGTASSLSIMEPMFATLFSVIVFAEKLSPAGIVGIILILASAVFLGKNENVQ